MNAQKRNDRVTSLTSAWIDGTASAGDLRELNNLLNGDPEACECYLDLVELHAVLMHDQAGDAQVPRPAEVLPFSQSGELSRKPRSMNRRPGRFWVATAAAAAALMANLAVFWWQTGSGEQSGGLAADDGVAVLSRTVDPEWPDEVSPRGEGDAVPAGRFEIRSGLAQLEFFSGATVIVEGPAVLDLESAWRMACQSGRLRAFVPEPAQGFTIVTPDYQAVDLGTEFALSVGSDGRSEVHVVDGEIRLDDAAGKPLRHLTAGAALQSAEGNLTAIESRGDAFVDRQQLMNLAQNDWGSRYAGWLRESVRLRADPAVIAYFDFEGQHPWDRALENRTPGGSGSGAIIGAQWTQGRWPGKGSLEFKRITDRVRLKVPGEFESLTLAAWVRIEGFDRWLSSLMLTDGWEEGEIHWQISDKGELVVGVSGGQNSFSVPVIHPRDLGRWMHLAVVVDGSGEKGKITHYVDGEVIESPEASKPFPPLRIGDAEIGNWQSEGRDNSIRSLNGRIDEFVILGRVMSGEEIRAMCEAGRPNG
ncbi:MAG: hypothetical protein KDM64_02050 [Verrucomicrobiae bacterium]|nr:hypothetical protein [Verrucomicrobiae bacterium]